VYSITEQNIRNTDETDNDSVADVLSPNCFVEYMIAKVAATNNTHSIPPIIAVLPNPLAPSFPP
jgi:DNA-binding FadR family transcriptional regulator